MDNPRDSCRVGTGRQVARGTAYRSWSLRRGTDADLQRQHTGLCGRHTDVAERHAPRRRLDCSAFDAGKRNGTRRVAFGRESAELGQYDSHGTSLHAGIDIVPETTAA